MRLLRHQSRPRRQRHSGNRALHVVEPAGCRPLFRMARSGAVREPSRVAGCGLERDPVADPLRSGGRCPERRGSRDLCGASACPQRQEGNVQQSLFADRQLVGTGITHRIPPGLSLVFQQLPGSCKTALFVISCQFTHPMIKSDDFMPLLCLPRSFGFFTRPVHGYLFCKQWRSCVCLGN